MAHRRTVGNVIWSLIVLAGIVAAAYYLLPAIGNWMTDEMDHRQTMHRPSGMDVSGELPAK